MDKTHFEKNGKESLSKEGPKISPHFLPIASFVTTLSGKVISWNSKTQDILGIDSEKAIGAQIEDIFSIENNTDQYGIILEQTKKKGHWKGEILCSVKNRPDIFASWFTVKHFDPEKVRTDIWFFILSPLEHSKRKNDMRIFERAVEQSIDGIAMADINGIIRFANKAWARMHGYYNKSELIGQALDLFHTAHQMVVDVIPFNNVVKDKGYNQGEVGHKRKDGSTFPAYMTTTMITDKKRQPVGFVGIARDITELLRSRNELRRIKNSLESMVASKTEDLRESNKKLERKIFEKERVSQSLKDSLTVASEIINAIPSGIFIFQYVPPDNLILIEANPVAMTLTGHTLDMAKGKGFNRLWPNAGGMGLTQNFISVIKNDEPFVVEDFQYMDDNFEGNFHIRAFKMAGEKLFVAFEDISTWKMTKKALNESEALFKGIFRNAIDGIYVENMAGKIIDANPAACKMLGYTRKELVGLNVSAILPEEVSSKLPDLVDTLLKKGSVSIETLNVKKDGTLIPVEVNLYVILTDGEQRIAAIVRDISNRKSNEARLVESENKFRNLFELSGDGIVLCDAFSQKILDVNQAACNLFALARENMIGDDLKAICAKENAEECLAKVDVTADGEKIMDEYFNIIDAKGEKKPVSVVANRVELKDKPVLQVVFRDMSTRAHLEEQLSRKAGQVALLNDILIHDIGNITQAAISYANLMSITDTENFTEEQVAYITKCKVQMSRVSEVLDKVGTISMATSNSEKAFTSIDLSDVISESINQIKSLHHEKEIRIDFSLKRGKKVFADRLLQQLFFNLLENGIKHNNSDTPSISITIENDKNSVVPCWTVIFKDNGPGIKNKIKTSIFKRFHSSESTRRLGLGLSIVKALADYYDGSVSVEDNSETKKSNGSRFIVSIPKG